MALAGLGAASVRGHLPALSRLRSEGRVTLVGAADPNVSRHRAVAAEPGDVPVFESTEEMLETVRSDLLVVATEPAVHAPLTLLGVAYRQHVLCEKPLTLTRHDHELVAEAYAGRPELGLVAMHQYRFSRPWTSIARCARVLNRIGAPFDLAVDVERSGTDRHAATPWRSDVDGSGGMLADHGVHFVALARTISEDLEVLGVARACNDAGRERSAAQVRVGCGVLDLCVSARHRARRTRVNLRVASLELGWTDTTARVTVGARTVGRWQVDALSDRRHVDELYLPLYRNLIANVSDPSWRRRRTAEALAVDAVLAALLELAPASVATR